eukprot:UN31279
MRLNWPDNRVEGSERITITLTGDLMGSAMTNLDSLVRQPTGCGEQNMILMAPQVYVWDYLFATDQLEPSIKSKLIKNIHTGYTREQEYKHTTPRTNYGAFSAFGDSDDSPSMWLTSFVASVFIDVLDIEDQLGVNIVDPEVIKDAINWMLDQQAGSDGHFPIVGRVIHTDMKGGVTETDSMTCFVAVPLIKAKHATTNTNKILEDESIPVVKKTITKVYNIVNGYLTRDLKTDEIYPMTICTYALTLLTAEDNNIIANGSIDTIKRQL